MTEHEAIAALRRALRCDPRSARAACDLGRALLDAGDIDEATIWLERAVDLEPRNGSFHLALVQAGASRMKPGHVDALMTLAADAERLPQAQRIDLHFALGQMYERQDRIDDAFTHLLAANALRRAGVRYDEAKELAFLRLSEAAFDASVVAALSGAGPGSDRPVFIFGMPRSGSTLVEQLLAAHPDVDPGGEIGLLGGIVREAWATMPGSPLTDVRTGVGRIGERYLAATDELGSGAKRLTDKTLYNAQFAPLITVALPNARMIHVRRDALDTCLSCFATNFADGQVPFSYELRELGRYYGAHARTLARWSAFLPRDRFLEVSYERLVDDFEAEARRIVGFCGLPWNAACLDFHRVRRPIRTASNVQARQPLFRSSVRRARPFLQHLAPLIDVLGAQERAT